MKSKVLSQKEVEALIVSPFDDEDTNIRRAFLFCLYSGLRFDNVKDLTYANINIENKMLEFRMHSTGGLVRIPLTDSLLDLIGDGKKDELIFPQIPSSYAKCTKILTNWAHAAGIDKQIEWSYARHFFACSLVANDATSIEIVANLLGHGLGYDYSDRDGLQINYEAMERLPKLNINSYIKKGGAND